MFVCLVSHWAGGMSTCCSLISVGGCCVVTGCICHSLRGFGSGSWCRVLALWPLHWAVWPPLCMLWCQSLWSLFLEAALYLCFHTVSITKVWLSKILFSKWLIKKGLLLFALWFHGKGILHLFNNMALLSSSHAVNGSKGWCLWVEARVE